MLDTRVMYEETNTASVYPLLVANPAQLGELSCVSKLRAMRCRVVKVLTSKPSTNMWLQFDVVLFIQRRFD